MESRDAHILAIGKRISVVRHNLRLSQAEFAVHIGVTKGAVAQYETGRNLPKMSRMEKIAKIGSCSVEWLLTGDDPEQVRRAHTENEAETLRLLRALPEESQVSAIAMLRGLVVSQSRDEKKT